MSPSLVVGLCLVLVAPAEAPDTRKAAVAFVVKLQNEDGGYRATPKEGPSSLRATSTALRAIKYFGGQLPRKEASAKFVAACFDRTTGGFADTPGGKPDALTTAIGLMALVSLDLTVDPPAVDPAIKYLDANAKTFEEVRLAVAGLEAVGRKAPRADAWIEQIKKMSNADGTFGSGDGQARDTGGAVVALLRLGVRPERRDTVLAALDAGQRASGGFGKAGAASADLETTYRVMRGYHMLQAKPAKVDALKTFLARCRNADGGFGVAPGEPSTVSGTYYVAIITHWLEEK
jgi:hypothetical protein